MFQITEESFNISPIGEKHEAKIKQIAQILYDEPISDALAINKGVLIYLTHGLHKVTETIAEFNERRKQ